MAKGGGLANGTGAEHGHKIIGKKWGPEEGNTDKRGKEKHFETTTTQLNQPQDHVKHGNINFYKNMIHHGEGGMIAPGECPLTVGPGPGSKFRGPIEKLKPSGE